MRAAIEFAEESKCAAKKVSCIIVKENSIIAIGVNGTAPKTVNCCDRYMKHNGKWFRVSGNERPLNSFSDDVIKDGKTWLLCEDQREHYKWSIEHETHAEINALSRAGKDARGSVAYITHSPCLDCSKALGAFGIAKVYYYEEYDNIHKSEETLRRYGAAIQRLII